MRIAVNFFKHAMAAHYVELSEDQLPCLHETKKELKEAS